MAIPPTVLAILSFLLAVIFAAPATTFADDPRAPRFAVDPETPPADWVLRPATVLAPEESIAAFDLPPGFRVETVAAEPLVQDPIAAAFAPDGRIWVLEYPGYNWEYREPLGLPEAPTPACRIVVLEDTDGDGRMNSRSVFADGLDNARAIALVGGGVLVGMPPEIRFYRDTTGDGTADEHRVVAGDFGPIATVHSQPSALFQALDNWIYSTRFDARLRLRGGRWEREPVPPRGQWGISQDDTGRQFFNTQADPLRADLLPLAFARRNPHLASAPGVNVRIAHDLDGTRPHAPTPGVNQRWGGFLGPDGLLAHFTSACSPAIFRGTRLPPEVHGDAFVCVPAGNLVRHYAIARGDDGSLEADNAWPNHEFLFSHDERFRPVQAQSGPGGALYLVDMHRGIIEGHTWISEITRDYILARELHEPFNGLGRIYRIVHEDHADDPTDSEPPLSELDPEGWVGALASPDGWRRDAAQRLLVEHDASAEILESLRALAVDREAPELARLHALWSLEGLEALDTDLLAESLADPSALLREHALQLAAPLLDEPGLLDRALGLASDPDFLVVRQLLLTLGDSENPRAFEAMRRLLHAHANAPLMPEVALSGLHEREFAFLESLLADPEWQDEPPGGDALLPLLSEAVSRQGDPVLLLRLAKRLESAPAWTRRPLLAGLAKGDHNRIAAAPEAIRALLELEDESLRKDATDLVASLKPTPSAKDIDPETLEEPVRSLYQRGQAGALLCAACHQFDWRGAEGVAPPLLGSEWMEQDPAAIIRIVLHGYEHREDLPPMASLGALGDDQIASILTYLRLTLSQETTHVLPEQVARIRAAPVPRDRPWSHEALQALESVEYPETAR